MSGSQCELLNVYQLLEASSQKRPDKEAVYDRTRRLTYAELLQETDRIAAALDAKGIKQGDRVGVSLPNWHETVAIYFAVSKIGAILVPFNTKYRLHEAQHIIKDSGIKLLFVSAEFDEQVGVESVAPLVQGVVSVRFDKEGIISLESLIEQAGNHVPALVEIDPVRDVFCVLYTSGTTGFPKGAMLTHRGMVWSGRTIGESIHSSPEDVYLIPAPLFHIFGMGINLFAAISMQSKIVLMDVYKAKEALELIQQEKITVHHAVPTMYILELNHPDFASYDLSSLRTGVVGGAPCPAETIRAIKEKMRMNICNSFGMSEIGSLTITAYQDTEKNIHETIGKAIPGAEAKIVNDSREPVPFGEVGEIACRSFGVMKGYYNNPEQTSQVIDQDGWFYTGDLGVMQPDGYIRFVGRKKEMIIRGGYNIYPGEIEEILYQHPKVLQAAVIGLPDPVMGEIACAVIKLKADEQSSNEEMLAYVKQHLADYKVPKQVVFTESLPATASGKIQKLKLKEAILKQASH